ncbi:MAG: hypothetical protein ABIQ17_00565 [Candidatus Limnocylindrales bacterium]
MTGPMAAALSAALTMILTSVVFVVLAQWSAGGAAPWTIVPGVARGVRHWMQRESDLPALRFASPGPFDLSRSIGSGSRPSARDARSNAELGADGWASSWPDPDSFGQAEIEELGERRI